MSQPHPLTDVTAPTTTTATTTSGKGVAAVGTSTLASAQGKTTIADTVVSKIAGIAAREVSGVYALGGGASRVVGVLVLGSLLSLAPAVVAGLLLGAVTGGLLTWSWRHQGLVRAWLTGSVVAYVAALVLNATVLLRHRPQPLLFEHWLSAVGLPSILYVLVLGGVGVSLYLTGTADERAAVQGRVPQD